MSAIYREFSTWKEALAAAGLLNVLQPTTHLGVVDGRPKGGGKTWSRDDKIRAVALCLEALRGRRFSWDAYKEFRRGSTRKLPGAEMLSKKNTGMSWDELVDAAEEYVLDADPALFPAAHDHLSRLRRLTDSSTEKAA